MTQPPKRSASLQSVMTRPDVANWLAAQTPVVRALLTACVPAAEVALYQALARSGINLQNQFRYEADVPLVVSDLPVLWSQLPRQSAFLLVLSRCHSYADVACSLEATAALRPSDLRASSVLLRKLQSMPLGAAYAR